jgi:UDP-glucose 4-epimerase
VSGRPVDGAARQRVLVTGGSGFIGRHVVSALRQAGHEVLVADLDPFPDPAVATVVGDLRDARVLEAAVTPGTDAVVHLAAFTSVLGSVQRPAEVHRTNVEMTAALVEAARRMDVPAVVFASTNAVIGDVGQRTITEDLPTAPLTPYGGTKAAAEMLLSGYAGSYGLRAPVLRLTNVYGAGMGHKDSFVPRLMRAAASGGEVEIYGDGEQRRDLVSVDDVAHAVTLAVRGWPSGPVIIGGSRSYTVNEITDSARRATGRPIRARHVAAKPGEMPAVVVDISKARSLGFRPRTALLEGMRTVWDDFAAPAEALRP